MSIAFKSNRPLLKNNMLALQCSCCDTAGCVCVQCRNGCAFYVSGEGYDTYEARCQAPDAPAGGSMLWIPPSPTSSPGFLSSYSAYDGSVAEYNYIHLGKASLQAYEHPMQNEVPYGSNVGTPLVWGHRNTYRGTGQQTYYQWYAGFQITCVQPIYNRAYLNLRAYLRDYLSWGNGSKAIVVTLQKSENGDSCKSVSVDSESRYNECTTYSQSWCRIEIPFPLTVQINGYGATINGTLYAWTTPVVPETPASVSFTVFKRDCCFNCESASSNICCNPLP